MNLAPKDFPEFAQAIQYSIATPAALCHEKLREKDPNSATWHSRKRSARNGKPR